MRLHNDENLLRVEKFAESLEKTIQRPQRLAGEV